MKLDMDITVTDAILLMVDYTPSLFMDEMIIKGASLILSALLSSTW